MWATIIFFLSSQQTTGIGGTRTQRFVVLKFFHLVEYSLLTILLIRAIAQTITQIVAKHAWFGACVIALLFAISDEFHQAFVPGREGRIRDIIIDLIGICLGCIITYMFRQIFKNYKTKVKCLG